MHGGHVLFNFISSICGEIAMMTEIWLLFHMNCRCMSFQLIFSGENLITECAAKRFGWVKSLLKILWLFKTTYKKLNNLKKRKYCWIPAPVIYLKKFYQDCGDGLPEDITFVVLSSLKVEIRIKTKRSIGRYLI